MSGKIHGLAQFLPDRSSLDECSLDELRHLTKRYPFFAPAQFLLLQKLKETGSPDFEAQYRKAVLYFPDPLQFDYFVSSERFLFDDVVPANPFPSEHGTAPAHDADEALLSEDTVADEQSFLHTEETAGPLLTEEAQFDLDNKESTYDPPITEVLSGPESTIHAGNDETGTITEPDKVYNTEDVETAEPAILYTQPLQETITIAEVGNEATSTDAATGSSTTISAPSPDIITLEETTIVNDDQAQAERVATEERTPPPAATPSEPLLFEPFHTVDYFASQGIKISQEDINRDKLSRQLRSFTEWLKIMKRLPVADIEQTPQSSAEKNVESMASHSVEGADVVTEAMAEVWAKQGAREKAIETYNKLSLQNPSKKAYFAAKIENLSRS